MNKVVLVTGSSRGIGRATIIEFAKEGYDVVINYNNSYDEAISLKDKVEKEYNVRSLVVKCDVSLENEVDEMFKLINSTFNRIDVVVNNASIAIDTTFEDKTVANFRKILDINLIGTFLVSKYASKYMNSGSIINISSTNGIDTLYPESMDYDASKAGVVSLTKNLATTLAPNIRVNTVAPGWVNTDMNKELDQDFINEECSKILLNRFADSFEIAKVVTFLASDAASYINGSIIRVDGGCK